MKKGKLGTLDLRLARGAEKQEAYQRRYIPVDPQDARIVGNEFGLSADDQVKVWRITSWVGGEHDGQWDPERSTYRKSLRVRPARLGDGLTLGPNPSEPVDVSADTVEGELLDFGFSGPRLTVYGTKNSAATEGVWSWNYTNKELFLEESFTALSSNTNALAGVKGAVWITNNADVIKVTGAGTTTIHSFGSLTSDLLWWRDRLFVLMGNDDLYEINTPDSAGGGATQRVDAEVTNTAVYRRMRRLAGSDVGPVWWTEQSDGDVILWEYNVGADTGAVIGKLPGTLIAPWDTYWAFGFIFVGFRYTVDSGTSTAPGPGYLYYQRGSQVGVAGPFREDGIDWSAEHHWPNPVGLDGDDLLVLWAGGLWAYNLSSGGIFHLGEMANDDRFAVHGSVLGTDVLTIVQSGSTSGGTYHPVVRWDLASYTTQTARLDSGAFDFQYPGLDKILMDVTVETDPLPADTSVQVAVSVDGGSFTTLSGTHDTDGATSTTFTASTSSAALRGKTFELRLMLATTDSDVTPTVRAVSARATGAAHRVEWVLLVDAGDGDGQVSKSLIDGLNGLGTASSVVAFSDPWQNPDHDTADSFDVTVEEIITPRVRDGKSDASPIAQVRLRSVSLV